jgi:hypothetical protein
MMEGATIAGWVFGPTGQPADDAAVYVVPEAALQQRATYGGLAAFKSIRAGKNGEFRAAGLNAGTYYLLADLGTPTTSASRGRAGTVVSVPTFFPSAERLRGAVGVSLGLAETRAGLRIDARLSQLGGINGTVLGHSASGSIRVTAEAVELPSGVQAVRTTDVRSDGRFELDGLPPGTYILRARESSRDVRPPVARSLGFAKVELPAAIELEATLANWPSEVTGQLRFRGSMDAGGWDVVLQRVPLDSSGADLVSVEVPPVFIGEVGRDGSFRVDVDRPGRYRLDLRNRHGPRDQLAPRVSVNGVVGASVLVTFEGASPVSLDAAFPSAGIRGDIAGDRRLEPDRYTVVALPVGGSGAALVAAPVDSKYGYELRSLVPGRYSIALLQDVPEYALGEVHLEYVRASPVLVTLEEYEIVSVSLAVSTDEVRVRHRHEDFAHLHCTRRRAEPIRRTAAEAHGHDHDPS